EPTPTPEPTPAPFDFTQPAPATEAVEMDYFSDALFIGDSRTDGLRLYSGITGADFYCYKGLTIFEMESKQVIELDGSKYTVVEALERGKQYKKIYISLGINELGYYNDEAFHNTFASFLEKVRELQPDAVIYLENLVPVNPDKCKANKQAYYVNNDRVAAYNAIFPQLAQEEHVVLLDVATALSDENGILPADATVDGVHFTKAWYQKWLAYLMEHTVDAEVYQAGVAAAEGVSTS
ncbi:GDSL-type esterase/lipase family protein, partial [Flavonifractor sp. An306]|uniref:GDSL-type esterase/lipase family protein n=2 Tax=Oscillospiraceae TaxID=216572 RepID=UPI000B550229